MFLCSICCKEIRENENIIRCPPGILKFSTYNIINKIFISLSLNQKFTTLKIKDCPKNVKFTPLSLKFWLRFSQRDLGPKRFANRGSITKLWKLSPECIVEAAYFVILDNQNGTK